jgi:hypothetical protein
MIDKIKIGDEVIFIKNYRGIVQAGETHVVDKVIEIKGKVEGVYIKLDFTWVYMSSDMFNEYCKKKVITEQVVIEEIDRNLNRIEDEIISKTIKNIHSAQDNYLIGVENFCEKFKKSVNLNTAYDYINPSHYKLGTMETFDMMVLIWGKEKAIAHCEMTAFKYRMRAGKKPDQPIERDMEKAKWYDNKANELRNGKN